MQCPLAELQTKKSPSARKNKTWAYQLKVSEVIMTNLMTVGNNKMMSSKKIAELTDKLNKNVIRDIVEMVAQLDGSVLSHEQYQEVNDNRGYCSEILLDEELTMLLITGYSVKARMRVIKELKQLKEQQSQPAFQIPSTLSGALMLAAQQAEQIEQQHALIQQQAPAVAAIERLGSSKGSLCLTDAAKALDMNPRAFTTWLEMKGWIFKRVAGDNWTAYQTKIDAGYLEMISVSTGELGQEKMRKQCKVTASGMVKLAKLFDAINGKTEQEEVKPISVKHDPREAMFIALGIRKPVINGIGA